MVSENLSSFIACNSFSTICRPVATIEEDAITTLANFCDGDARSALNNLESVTRAKITANDELKPGQSEPVLITVDDVKDGMLHSHLQYDRTGESHFSL